MAERKFEKLTEHVVRGAGIYSGAELDWTDAKREILDVPKGTLDEVIVCKIIGEKGERLQILALLRRKTDQEIYPEACRDAFSQTHPAGQCR